MTLASAAWIAHAAVTLLLAIHSAEYLLLAWRRARRGLRPVTAQPAPPVPADAPHVLLQVPVRGDEDQLPGCAEAVAALEWPRSRLHVQLLDDSPDPRPGQAFVARLQRAGTGATLVRRNEPTGAKAGALAHGMRLRDEPVIVPLDVDFRPAPDLLRHLVAPLDSRAVACVQARWSVRPAAGPLAWAQRLALAGHFHVEQAVRAERGSLMSFNATACAWRRAAIDAAGGWSDDTLTEDLATRVLLQGGRFAYLEHVAVPSAVPTRFSAFVVQQARWARGSMQCSRRHARAALRRRSLPRWQTLFHLGHYSLHPLVVLLFATQAALAWAGEVPRWYAWAAVAALLAGPLAMYTMALRTAPELRLRDALAVVPLSVYGLAAAPRLAWEAAAGALGARGRFHTTPKAGRRAPWRVHGPAALSVALLTAAWAWAVFPGGVLAPGVAAFGACCAVGAILR